MSMYWFPEYRRKMEELRSQQPSSKADKYPFGLCITIIQNTFKGDKTRSDIGNNIKEQTERYLRENGIMGLVFLPDMLTIKSYDLLQLLILSEVVILDHITANNHPSEFPEIETYQQLCPGKKIVVVSTDLRETPETNFLRSAVDFFIKYPLDPRELLKMMRMFVTDFFKPKQSTEGIVIPAGEGIIHK